MATVIDSLLVTLGLDPSSFKRGTKEAEKATDDLAKKTEQGAKKVADTEKKLSDTQKERSKQLNEQTKKTVDGFAKARNELLGFLTLFTAGKGLADFAASTVTSLSALDRLGEVVGAGVNNLAAWNLAAKNVGGTAQEMSANILQASQDLGGLKTGIVSPRIAVFRALGMSSAESSADTDTQTYLLAQARIVKEQVAKLGEKGAFAMFSQRTGMSLNEFNLLKMGNVELQKQLDLDAKITGVTEEQAKQAREMQQRWNNLKEKFEQTGRTVMVALRPALEEVGVQLDKFADWAINHKDEIKQWGDDSVSAVKKFVQEADDAAQAVGGWKNVLEGLIALKVASMVAPLLQLASALMGVGVSLAAISRVGIPAALGYLAGTELYNHVIKGTKADDWLGEKEAQLMAFLGSKDAQDALDTQARSNAARPPAPTATPRGIRNNNPGNLRYGNFAASHGASGQDSGGFAIFRTMEEGVAAQKALLASYLKNKIDTIRKVLQKYAPSSENNTSAYINDVSRRTGINPDAVLTAKDIAAVSRAIFTHENGKKYAQVSNSNTSTTHIDQMNIHTQATDANGIASDMRGALTSNDMAWQMNTGVVQ